MATDPRSRAHGQRRPTAPELAGLVLEMDRRLRGPVCPRHRLDGPGPRAHRAIDLSGHTGRDARTDKVARP